eukprot:CAMPEP_0172304828 /NCGR_PEP_ID=MMETSP1058-20130122/6205_1 /TAXON_ID=83371 /ORGANISM="Detonula confervacea, Strain CCMP 353" /LENGTH=47 /DNA_ID= /DNA_START= /DNA_END= /DNA_ORIENTATION=
MSACSLAHHVSSSSAQQTQYSLLDMLIVFSSIGDTFSLTAAPRSQSS